MQEIHKYCLGSDTSSGDLFRLMNGRAILFRPETIGVSFLHLGVQSTYYPFLKPPVCGVSCCTALARCEGHASKFN